MCMLPIKQGLCSSDPPKAIVYPSMVFLTWWIVLESIFSVLSFVVWMAFALWRLFLGGGGTSDFPFFLSSLGALPLVTYNFGHSCVISTGKVQEHQTMSFESWYDSKNAQVLEGHHPRAQPSVKKTLGRNLPLGGVARGLSGGALFEGSAGLCGALRGSAGIRGIFRGYMTLCLRPVELLEEWPGPNHRVLQNGYISNAKHFNLYLKLIWKGSRYL